MRTKHNRQQRTFIGIDNGVSGSIGVIVVSESSKRTYFHSMPVFQEQNYTKAKYTITRVHHKGLYDILLKARTSAEVVLERPLTSPHFKAVQSALRALEAILIVTEMLLLPITYIDSKEWQKVLLPKGTKGTPELKKASVDIGCRLFPEHREAIVAHGDADGLLIAEWARRTK